MQAVGQQFDQPNGRCRPVADIGRPELVATKLPLAPDGWLQAGSPLEQSQ